MSYPVGERKELKTFRSGQQEQYVWPLIWRERWVRVADRINEIRSPSNLMGSWRDLTLLCDYWIMSTLFRGGEGVVWGGGGAAFEVPLTKKLNNFKAVQTGTTNLSDFSKNLSGNLKFISWSLCQHWCYHGNRVLASTVFSLKNRLYFYFNRWNYYITLYLALFYQSYCNMSFIWPNDRCWLKFSTVLISLSKFHTLMIFFFGGGGGVCGFLSILLYSEIVSFLL